MSSSNKVNRKKKAGNKIAVSGSNRDFWGYTCIVVGCLFAICAIFIFIFSNRMNFFAEKATATILTQSDLETEDGKLKQMLTISYRVGNEMVVTTYVNNKERLPEDTVSIDIYYNVKKPRFIIEDGWLFDAVPVFVLGVVILLIGLVIKGLILQELRLFEDEPPKYATKYQREVFPIRQKVIENFFPFSAAALVCFFGIYLIISSNGWGSYVFLVVGIIGMIYVGLELFPAIYEWNRLYRLSKIKVKVVDIRTEELSSDEQK